MTHTVFLSAPENRFCNLCRRLVCGHVWTRTRPLVGRLVGLWAPGLPTRPGSNRPTEPTEPWSVGGVHFVIGPQDIDLDTTMSQMPHGMGLRWEPWHQGDRAPQPCHPGARAFFLFFLYFFCGNYFFWEKQMEKNCVFSLFFLSFSLSFSLSLYTQFGFFLV